VEPQIVTASVSPNGNLEAFVEQDGRCAYLYLREVDDPAIEPAGFGVKSCWVRNLKEAPASLSVAEMRQGLAPMMPRASCAHPAGDAPLAQEALRIVWFEEGDAAALLEGDSVLAIVPCWSGEKGFYGYARDCTSLTPFAWPLAPDNVLRERVRAADEYWRAWCTGSPWAAVQDAGVRAIAAAFGAPASCHATDAGSWPPQALVRCAHGDAAVLATCGMQLRPQPTVELSPSDPRPRRRIELGLAIERRLFDLRGDAIAAWISERARYPWRRLSWLGDHHTVSCDAIPTGPSGRAFTAVLLLREPVDAPPVAFPPFRNDPVTLLWLVPITDRERRLAELEGSAVLARLLSARRHGFVHRDRAPVA
jgi:hypothetical protein